MSPAGHAGVRDLLCRTWWGGQVGSSLDDAEDPELVLEGVLTTLAAREASREETWPLSVSLEAGSRSQLHGRQASTRRGRQELARAQPPVYSRRPGSRRSQAACVRSAEVMQVAGPSMVDPAGRVGRLDAADDPERGVARRELLCGRQPVADPQLNGVRQIGDHSSLVGANQHTTREGVV